MVSPNIAHPWSEDGLKALLRLANSQACLLDDDAMQGWMAARGGSNAVRSHLLECNSLTSREQALIGAILEYPERTADFYAEKLSISRNTYFRGLNTLLPKLTRYLNRWDIAPSPSQAGPSFSLPAPLTSLVGAEETSAALIALLRRPGVRLVTITGPGGIGKTRLAIQAATSLLADFKDGVFFIQLETIRDPALLPVQIAHSMSLDRMNAQPVMGLLKGYLQGRQALLVLDNFEQLVEAGPLVVELLQTAPGLKILITSRTLLNLYGEHRFNVPELPHPTPGRAASLEALQKWPAIRLFIERARATQPGFTLNEDNRRQVVQICHHLDGIPLAIELAAAQIKRLPPGSILPSLEQRINILFDAPVDRPPRQQTLQGTMDWSYQLLTEPEKKLFRQLSIFGREFGLEAVSAICRDEQVLPNLKALMDKSLVESIGWGKKGEMRFRMLHPIREYAREQLESQGDSQAVQLAHANYFLSKVKEAEEEINAPEKARWEKWIQQEHSNLQIALAWMLDHQHTDMAFDLLGAVWRYWIMFDTLNYQSEALLWMERALTQGSAIKSIGHVKTLWGASWLADGMGSLSRKRAYSSLGLAMARELGDQRMIGLFLQLAADNMMRSEEHQQAIDMLQTALKIFQELGDDEETAWVFNHLGRERRVEGRFAEAREAVEASLAIFEKISHQRGIRIDLTELGYIAAEEGNEELARAYFTECLTLSIADGSKQQISLVLRELGKLAWRGGDVALAKEQFEKSLAIYKEIGDPLDECWVYGYLGEIALEEGDHGKARSYLEKARGLLLQMEEMGQVQRIDENLERLAQAGKGRQP